MQPTLDEVIAPLFLNYSSLFFSPLFSVKNATFTSDTKASWGFTSDRSTAPSPTPRPSTVGLPATAWRPQWAPAEPAACRSSCGRQHIIVFSFVLFFFFEQGILVYAFCIRCTLLHVGFFFLFSFWHFKIVQDGALAVNVEQQECTFSNVNFCSCFWRECGHWRTFLSLLSALRITVTVLLQIEFELSFPDNVVIVCVVVFTWAVVASDDWYYQIAICWQDMSIFFYFSSLTVSNSKGPYVWLVPVCGTYCYMYRLCSHLLWTYFSSILSRLLLVFCTD